MAEQARRYRATIAYDGTGYHGFQRQANASPTVQGTLEEALETVTRQRVGVTGAGRTDAGVHAQGQVVAFDLIWRHAPGDLQNALNATLPEDVAVWQVGEAGAGFHPRFDAVSRVYRYSLLESAERHPMRRRTHWHVRERLDATAIEKAIRVLEGEHDFATFGTPPQGINTRRTVRRAAWSVQQQPEEEARTHVFEIEANAFLYRMVRSLVGTLRDVGAGRTSPGQFAEMLGAADRTRSGPTAPAHGLVLVAVNYDN